MYQPIIGLEIHVELATKSKMFCSCCNDPNEKNPNTNICPICLGHPGTLPVINKEAVRKVIKTGLALNCEILAYSKFDRKNYFYPDLPKGYQISQYDAPLCKNGYLNVGDKKIRIRRIHLEEDTGRLIHPLRDSQKKEQKPLVEKNETTEGFFEKDFSLIDFNRAGIPLMELVTEPDMTSAMETRKFAEELHIILHYLNVSDADMEKGEMRVEVNISLAKTKGLLGTKVEIKNLNSFRAVEQAIEYEIERQKELLNRGKKIIQETRGWIDTENITESQRVKEEAYDYRYFPEPDLPPLQISQEMINEIRATISELPQGKRKRFKKEYQLDEKSIEFFAYNKELGEYFEKTMSELRQWVKEKTFQKELKEEEFYQLSKLCSNYIISDLQGLLKSASIYDENFLITPENFAELITLLYRGKISSKIAKLILREMFQTGADPSHIIEEKNLIQIVDEAELEKIAKDIIAKNQKAVEDFKKGKVSAFQYLIGQIMAKTKGKVNPQALSKILAQLLTNIK